MTTVNPDVDGKLWAKLVTEETERDDAARTKPVPTPKNAKKDTMKTPEFVVDHMV